MYKFKSLCLFFIFFISSTFVSNVLCASNIVNRNYAYVQLGASVDVLNKLFISLRSYDGEKDIWETNDYYLTGYGDINPYISMGFYLNSAKLAMEVEYGVHTAYEKKFNGNTVVRDNSEKAYVVMNYFFINAKKNLITLFSNKNILYAKLGIGVAMVNNVTLNKSSSMNVPTPAAQGGLGFTRMLNNYIDLDLAYNYKVNFPKRTQVSNGVKQIYRLQAHSIIASVKFKI